MSSAPDLRDSVSLMASLGIISKFDSEHVEHCVDDAVGALDTLTCFIQNNPEVASLIIQINEQNKETPILVSKINNVISIDNININQAIFDDKISEYTLSKREDKIAIIQKSLDHSTVEKYAIESSKFQLKYLQSCNDEFILENIFVFNFVAASIDPNQFNKICKKILALN